VAIKLLLGIGNQMNDQQLSRLYFEREIAILSQIRHPNIVAILDSGISDKDQPYMIMDYIEGATLSEIMRSQGIWALERTLHLLKQICPALHAMHLKNIIHRDLKPANIIIQGTGPSEVAMLLDLGIAKKYCGSVDGSPVQPITQAGMLIGTVEYISPEQCLDEEIDQRVDIYSLGIMVFELLTGQLPFDALTVGSFLLAHVQTPPPPLRSINPKISEAVEKIVLWAIAKDPNERPNTTMEFLQHFEEAVNLSENSHRVNVYSGKSSASQSTPTLTFPHKNI
jgi:serine/threonine-protein kinase